MISRDENGLKWPENATDISYVLNAGWKWFGTGKTKQKKRKENSKEKTWIDYAMQVIKEMRIIVVHV
jgi:hypothetical protein